MLTEKENYLMALRGEVPEWVPRSLYASPGRPPANAWVGPSILNERRTPEGGFDVWGVEFVATRETGGQALPVPGKFLLDRKPLKWICGCLVLAFLFLLDFRSQHHVQLYGVSSRELYFSRSKVKELLLLLLFGWRSVSNTSQENRIRYLLLSYHHVRMI